MLWIGEQRQYNVRYYARNRKREIDRVTRRQRATLAWLRDLRRVPCLDCGGTFAPYVMDFDHRDPRSKSFSIAADNVLLKNRALLEAEVAKCDVVCANCHRVRTAAQHVNGILDHGFKVSPVPARTKDLARRRERWHRRRDEQIDLLDRLRGLGCCDCGGKFPLCAMEFDHRPGSPKRGLVTQMAGRVRIRTLLEEVAKCDIVCVNCHRERSHQRRNAGVAQLARAAAFQAAGRGFETRLPLTR